MNKWLKKYMKIEYLEKTLMNKELYLGDPEEWPDKNDSAVIEIYRAKRKIKHIRATCLTMARDRYHFWALFGEKESGVCLWFNKEKLINDITNDVNLRAKEISYYTPEQLRRKCNFSNLPFAKRKQYKDEKEYRILKELCPDSTNASNGVEFKPESLERVYFNSWLGASEFAREKSKAKIINPSLYKHVKFLQNRAHKFEKWIEAADMVG